MVPTQQQLLVDCPACSAMITSGVVGEVEVYEDDNGSNPARRFVLLTCGQCSRPLFVQQECHGWTHEHGRDRLQWLGPVRLWPEPDREIDQAIPPIVAVSLEEAQQCHRAGTHTACAVMCGRAIEGVCRHFQVKARAVLAEGLKELVDRGIIDRRLFEWGSELRVLRNLAAHASEQRISKQDSTDVLHFAAAICEYVFVLTARFDAFRARRASVSTPTASPPDPEVPDA